MVMTIALMTNVAASNTAKFNWPTEAFRNLLARLSRIDASPPRRSARPSTSASAPFLLRFFVRFSLFSRTKNCIAPWKRGRRNDEIDQRRPQPRALRGEKTAPD
jgi:hypothetical protein